MRILKVEYAEVKVVIICKINPLIQKNVAFTIVKAASLCWYIIAGNRANLIIKKKPQNLPTRFNKKEFMKLQIS